MSKYIVFLLVIMPLFSLGQLKGKYCLNNGFFSECLVFKSDFTFKYSSSGCTSSQQGFGKYKLDNKTLTLNFESDVKKEKSYEQTELISSIAEEDSINFYVQLTCEKTNESVPFANVFFKDDRDTIVAGKITELDGSCQLKIPKSVNLLTLHISYIGYKTFTRQVALTSDYQLDLALLMDKSFNQVLESGDTLVYKIKNIRKRKINLKKHYSYSKYQIYKRKI